MRRSSWAQQAQARSQAGTKPLGGACRRGLWQPGASPQADCEAGCQGGSSSSGQISCSLAQQLAAAAAATAAGDSQRWQHRAGRHISDTQSALPPHAASGACHVAACSCMHVQRAAVPEVLGCAGDRDQGPGAGRQGLRVREAGCAAVCTQPPRPRQPAMALPSRR